jgi:hypothetical protein
MTPCSIVVGYKRFGCPCCLHLQGEVAGVSQSVSQSWRWAHLGLMTNFGCSQGSFRYCHGASALRGEWICLVTVLCWSYIYIRTFWFYNFSSRYVFSLTILFFFNFFGLHYQVLYSRMCLMFIYSWRIKSLSRQLIWPYKNSSAEVKEWVELYLHSANKP